MFFFCYASCRIAINVLTIKKEGGGKKGRNSITDYASIAHFISKV